MRRIVQSVPAVALLCLSACSEERPTTPAAPAAPSPETSTTYTDRADFLRAAGTVTVVDFDRFPDGSAVPLGFRDDGAHTGFVLAGQEWSGVGVTFTSPIGAQLSTTSTISGIINYSSAPNALTPGSPPYVGPRGTMDDNDDDLDISLTPPVRAAGVSTIDGGSSPTEVIRFLDASGSTIAQFPFPGAGGVSGSVSFRGLVSSRLIARIVFVEDANDGDDVSYDDVTFAR